MNENDVAGQAAPARRDSRRAGAVWTKLFAGLSLALAAALCIALAYKPDAPKSFASPEKAVSYLVGRVRAGDERGALRAFAFTHKARSLNYGEYMALEGYYAFRTQAAPQGFERLNEAFFEAQAATGVRLLMLCANAGGENIVSALGSSVTALPVSELAPLLTSGGSGKLRLERVDAAPLPAELEKSAAGFNAAFGYEEAREYYVLVRLGARRYYFGITLAKTAEGWRVDGVGHTLSHRNDGLLRAADKDDYAAIIG